MEMITDEHGELLESVGVMYMSSNIGDYYSTLYDSEKILIGEFCRKRKEEFSTGRFLLRKLFAGQQHILGAIKVGFNGEPLFPKDILGSISHTNKSCFVAAGFKGRVKHIGVDIETIGRIRASDWPLLYTEHDYDVLSKWSNFDAALITTMIYSIKESYIKYNWVKYGLPCDLLDLRVSNLVYKKGGLFTMSIKKSGYYDSTSNKTCYASLGKETVCTTVLG